MTNEAENELDNLRNAVEAFEDQVKRGNIAQDPRRAARDSKRPSLMTTEVEYIPGEGFVATASWRSLSCIAVAPTPGAATSRAEEVVLESAADWVGEIVLPSARYVAARDTKVSPRKGDEPVKKSRLEPSRQRSAVRA